MQTRKSVLDQEYLSMLTRMGNTMDDCHKRELHLQGRGNRLYCKYL